MDTPDNDTDRGRWVDERMNSLGVDAWQPDASSRLGQAHMRRSADRSRRLRLAGALVVSGAIFAAVPVTRAFATRCVEVACVSVTKCVATIWPGSEPEASIPKGVGIVIGAFAPDLVGADFQGTPIRLSALRGQRVILNFWATWCTPCKAEIPILNDLQTRFGPSGVQVIGVSIDDDGWPAITQFLTQQGINYKVGLAGADVIDAYGGLGEIPMTFVIDRDGQIVAKHLGLLTEGEGRDQIARQLER